MNLTIKYKTECLKVSSVIVFIIRSENLLCKFMAVYLLDLPKTPKLTHHELVS